MKTPQLIAVVVILGISLGLGYSLYEKQTITPLAGVQEKPLQLDRLPEFSYPDLQGNMRTSSEWDDKIVVLNYWATWCPPCKKEIPLFISTQEKYSPQVQFVGIAIDDRQPVKQFADMMGVNYPTLLGDMNAVQTSGLLGNTSRGLPFTAIFDRSGNLHFIKSGEIQPNDLENQLQALL